jgi:hypothetical protein
MNLVLLVLLVSLVVLVVLIVLVVPVVLVVLVVLVLLVVLVVLLVLVALILLVVLVVRLATGEKLKRTAIPRPKGCVAGARRLAEDSLYCCNVKTRAMYIYVEALVTSAVSTSDTYIYILETHTRFVSA